MVLKIKNKSGEYSSLYPNSEKLPENFLHLNKKIQEDFSKELPFLEECTDMGY
jgi:hypothetical protein